MPELTDCDSEEGSWTWPEEEEADVETRGLRWLLAESRLLKLCVVEARLTVLFSAVSDAGNI